MSNISIKIVDIHQPTNSVLVKFASEHSAKAIDDYDSIAFQLTNYTSTTPEEFVKEITPYISGLVAVRDLSERPRTDIDLAAWNGFSTTFESTVTIPPASSDQQFAGLSDPEVTV